MVGALISPGARSLEWLARRSDKRIGLVLMYHEVGSEQGSKDDVLTVLGAGQFRGQMEHLKRHYEVVALGDLLARAQQRSAGEPIPVAITFDDDYSRHATIAAPLLSELGLPATFFLCGSALDGPQPFWWQDLQLILERGEAARADLKRELADEWPWAKLDGELPDLLETIEAAPPQLRDAIAAKLRKLAGPEVADQGLGKEAVQGLVRDGFQIGFHTRRHYRLQTLDGSALDDAMRDGLDELSDVIGYRPTAISYPHARADLRVADAARRAGFETGFLVGDLPTTAEQQPLLLARVNATSESLPRFKWKLGRVSDRP